MRREPHVRFCEGGGVKFPSATRLVICCKGRADEAMTAMRTIMGRLKLTVNEEKTRICDLPDGRFDFLGYNFGRCYSTKTGRALLGYATVEEEHPTHHRSGSHAYLEAHCAPRCRRTGEQAKSGAWRLGKLLLFGLGHQDISLRGRLHQSAAAPMAL